MHTCDKQLVLSLSHSCSRSFLSCRSIMMTYHIFIGLMHPGGLLASAPSQRWSEMQSMPLSLMCPNVVDPNSTSGTSPSRMITMPLPVLVLTSTSLV